MRRVPGVVRGLTTPNLKNPLCYEILHKAWESTPKRRDHLGDMA
jgi:hypothetical protein